jgi:RNA polymerase sigma-70 factor (ECF subfamily)
MPRDSAHFRHSAAPMPADEAGLVALAVARDEVAIRTLMRRYNQRLYRIARSVLRDDAEAEDALQQAYIRAFTHLSDFRGEARFSTWMSRIVLNEAIGRQRKRAIPATDDLSTLDRPPESHAAIIPFPSMPDPEKSLAQRQISALLEQAVDALPDAFRVVLVARVIEEMSIEETAELLALKPETVKTRLHRARRMVREHLEAKLGTALTTAFPFNGWRCDRMADRVVAGLGLNPG